MSDHTCTLPDVAAWLYSEGDTTVTCPDCGTEWGPAYGYGPGDTSGWVRVRPPLITADRFRPTFGEPVAGWHRWVAWHPVWTVDRGWVWLRVVHRRRVQKHDYLTGGRDWWWQIVVDP